MRRIGGSARDPTAHLLDSPHLRNLLYTVIPRSLFKYGLPWPSKLLISFIADPGSMLWASYDGERVLRLLTEWYVLASPFLRNKYLRETHGNFVSLTRNYYQGGGKSRGVKQHHRTAKKARQKTQGRARRSSCPLTPLYSLAWPL